MRGTEQRQPRAKSAARAGRLIARLALLFVALTMAATRLGAQGCYISVPTAAGTVTLDGTMGAGEWTNAGIASSNDGCLEPLPDYDTALGYLPRNVTLRMQRDATNIYVFVEVADPSQGTATDDALGERVILQLDPGDDRQLKLATGAPLDSRIDVEHSWNFVSGSQKLTSTLSFYRSNVGNTSTCMKQQWGTTTQTSVPSVYVRANESMNPSGYTVEMKIPSTAIDWSAGQNLGIAFAVVNDMKHASEYGAAAFPTNLHFTSDANGVLDPNTNSDPIGCGDWLVPKQWAHAYMGSAPGTVTMTQLPYSWLSDGIGLLHCYITGSGTKDYAPNYDYYPGAPCRIRVDAHLRNTDAAPAVRNVLYVWGNNDAASPTWSFMDLQKAVTIPPPSGGATYGLKDVMSNEWVPPLGLAVHPCMRVYILPTSFVGSYTEAWMSSMSNMSDGQLAGFVAAYGLVGGNSAQKNITRDAAGGCTGICLALRNLLDQPSANYFASASFGASFGVIVGAVAPKELQAQEPTPRRQVHLSQRDIAFFRRNDAIIELETVGYAMRGKYKFVEFIGGTTRIIPAQSFAANKTVPLTFNITNGSNSEMQIMPQIATAAPASLQAFKVSASEAPLRLKARQTVVFRVNAGTGTVIVPPGPKRDCFGRVPVGTSTGLVGAVVFVGFLVRRRRHEEA